MIRKKALCLTFAVLLAIFGGEEVYASPEDEIAYLESQRQEAEAGLAQAQAEVSSLESQKQDLEAYLAEINVKYNELTGSVSQLAEEAARKEEELKTLRTELADARQTADEQYEAMKVRIVYMYEKGGGTMLEMLLNADSFADFLNRAENISQISQYDRNMLKKFEDICEQIETDEEKVAQESEAINVLMREKSAKQQEVQDIAAATRESILSYTSQIENNEDVEMFMRQIEEANQGISGLIRQAADEQSAEEADGEETGDDPQPAEETGQDVPPDFDPETDSMGSSSSSTSSSVVVEEEAPETEAYSEEPAEEEEYYEEEDPEDDWEEDYTEEDYYEEPEESSDSGEGTYLGNFVLTAYCNCASCCGTAGNATASGVMPVAGRTVAMDGVPFGTELLINGNVYTVEDLGTPYGHVDIYCDSHEEALNFGMQYADVYQLN